MEVYPGELKRKLGYGSGAAPPHSEKHRAGVYRSQCYPPPCADPTIHATRVLLSNHIRVPLISHILASSHISQFIKHLSSDSSSNMALSQTVETPVLTYEQPLGL